MDIGVRLMVLGVLTMVGLIFVLGLVFVLFKFGRDRDRWNVVDEERLARDELLRENGGDGAPGPGRPGSL